MSAPSHAHQHQQGATSAVSTPHSHTNGHGHAPGPSAAPAGMTSGAPGAATGSSSTTTPVSTVNNPPVPHIRIVPHLDAPRSLHFEVVDKDVPEGFVLKIGRFTDKQSLPNRVTFKSKVVSRGHAEIFTEHGKFFIRDTKSSSGTFLNHARLSPPGVESKPTPLKDGDVVQLGVDYQGGTQEIYRCVKMRLELNRSWQQQANPFRMNTLKAIRSLTTATAASSTDCCICLFRIASFQSLFVAPCSHVYHYKCIRPMLMANHPGFLCPLCRTFADLEDSVEIDDPIEEDIPAEDVAAAIENATRGQGQGQDQGQSEAPVEQVHEGPFVQAEMPLAEAMVEEAYAPTPPSEQAHTFQLPEHDTYPAEAAAALSNAIQAQQELAPCPIGRDLDDHGLQAQAIEEAAEDAHVQPSADLTLQSPMNGETSRPMAISVPSSALNSSTGVTTSMSSSAQQSPSSAFFMAPSPPAHASSPSSSAPISFGSPRQQQSMQQNHASVSPSNHMTAAGHMIQNFVRNISIPTRNRARTNSNSPLNPMVHPQQGYGGAGAGAEGAAGTSIVHTTNGQGTLFQPGEGHGHSDSIVDVFGKTLVVAPPPMILGENTRGEASELGSLLEVEGEPGASTLSLSHDQSPDSAGDNIPGQLGGEVQEVAEQQDHEHGILGQQQQQQQQQQQYPQYPLQQTNTAETSV